MNAQKATTTKQKILLVMSTYLPFHPVVTSLNKLTLHIRPNHSLYLLSFTVSIFLNVYFTIQW